MGLLWLCIELPQCLGDGINLLQHCCNKELHMPKKSKQICKCTCNSPSKLLLFTNDYTVVVYISIAFNFGKEVNL